LKERKDIRAIDRTPTDGKRRNGAYGKSLSGKRLRLFIERMRVESTHTFT
jgi:hypothetical protein